MNAARRTRIPLTKSEIVEASLTLVETEGLPALTMRRVAELLGVAPMSLYRHVEDRKGLLVGMLDAVALSIPPVPRAAPHEELRRIMEALHQAFRAHRWVVLVLANDGLASEHIMGLMDQVFDCLFRAGLDEAAAVHAWQMLFHYLAGESLFAASHGAPTEAQRLMRAVDSEALPSLGRVLVAERKAGIEDDFEENSARLVDFLLGP